MRKALSITLALAMCIALVSVALTPLTAQAYGNEWIHIQRRTFIKDENIEIHVTGVTAQMVGDGAWVGIYEKGAAHGDIYDNKIAHFNDRSDPDYWDYAWFHVPDEDGEYELRLYSKDDGDHSAANLENYFLSSLTFFVGLNSGFAHGNQWIKLESDNFDPNESMLIYFFDITQQMVDDMACCYICPKGMRSEHLSGCPQIREVGVSVVNYVTAPVEPGEYEIVLLSKWWQNGSLDELLISAIAFTVGGVAKEGQISLDKAAYTALEPIVVSYSGITQEMANAKAFVRIHEKDTGATSYGGGHVDLGSGTITLNAPNQNGDFEVRLYSVDDGNWNATEEYLVMSVPFTVSGASQTSGWTQDQEIAEKAAQYGLIPGGLMGEDWTRSITRAEFAAVCVKLYENLTGDAASPAPDSTFSDTSDPDVLKAYNIGAVNGMPDGRFAPDSSLTREQMATMLTRVLKAVNIEGWTLETDSRYTLVFTMPPAFADDADISDYARMSVYFMFANEIINGMPGNMFAPRATTPAQQAANYAVATREQALAISVRIVENLKDEPLNFTQYTGAP
ncbi:MAG: S-layer homology domain-containing protein [Oscillospiraceae bacterium]|nr:S-layer homology domain-containing protein [Oscillospiraceae bacterium]